MIDFSAYIGFKTFRSGGKGGQNVNKVETAAEGSLDIGSSDLLSAEQKSLLYSKLQNRINAAGVLQIRSQLHRTQLANKHEVVRKINALVNASLVKKKARIATAPSKQSRERRINAKKEKSEVKQQRRKLKPGE